MLAIVSAAFLSVSAGSVIEQDDNRFVVDDALFTILAEDAEDRLTKIDIAKAQNINAAFIADKQLDAMELGFLVEAATDVITPLRFSLAKEGGRDLMAYRPQKEVRQLFATMLSDAYQQYWDGDDGDYSAMLKHSLHSEHSDAQLAEFALPKIREVWKQSNIGNAYAPTRGLITQLSDRNKRLPASDQAAGRMMLHRWFVRADRYEQDDIPDFLYRWLKPKGDIVSDK
tara:strand:- start:837 stop:1520 length:684 start_codon:yes stop_codon:yes gene_type:complete